MAGAYEHIKWQIKFAITENKSAPKRIQKMTTFILTILAFVIAYSLVTGLVGMFGPQDRVLGLNIKHMVKKRGLDVYKVDKHVWHDLGAMADWWAKEVTLTSADGLPPVGPSWLNLENRSYTPAEIRLAIVQSFAEIIVEAALNQQLNIENAEVLEKAFNHRNSSILDLR